LGSARDPFGIEPLVRAALAHADELLLIDDPLEAEHWASTILGVWYKLPAPFEAREELERSFGPRLVRQAEGMRNATGLAAICALAGVAGDEFGAREAASRMATRGVPRPRWADVVGSPEYLSGYTVADPFGDQIGYYLTFAYPGHRPHVLMALYDESLGGIIKDACAAELRDDSNPRTLLEADPDVAVEEVDPVAAAARIRSAVETGDLFIDNDWTEDFRHTRALLLARLRLLPRTELTEPAEPLDDESRERLVQEFFAASHMQRRTATLHILDHCLTARCDYGDGDPLRWSPTVVELFILDYLPRKANLGKSETTALPRVLTAWVRFCLTKRGLDERFIVQTEHAVADLTREFRKSMADPTTFGPAKAIFQALQADGVDVTDQNAVDAWISAFNARPDEDRFGILGPPGEP
jgi:hypothetical protein